jgi:hypothetical protein
MREAGLTRRRFLIAGAAGSASVALGLRCLKPEGATGPGVKASVPAPLVYGDWRDVYRERWRWDKVVRSSHFVNCWYQAHCAWNVYGLPPDERVRAGPEPPRLPEGSLLQRADV